MANKKRKRPEKAAYMRERRRKMADAGVCSICTVRPARPDLDTCKVCGAKGIAGKKKWRMKKRVRKLIGKA